MVDTQRQIKALDEELVTMRQLRYKLSNQLRGFKQLHKYRSIIKRVELCIKQIKAVDFTDIKQIDKLPAASLIKEIASVVFQCECLGRMLKDFIERVYLIQFATLALANTSVVHQNCLRMRKKLEVIVRIQSEREIKSKGSKQKPPNP